MNTAPVRLLRVSKKFWEARGKALGEGKTPFVLTAQMTADPTSCGVRPHASVGKAQPRVRCATCAILAQSFPLPQTPSPFPKKLLITLDCIYLHFLLEITLHTATLRNRMKLVIGIAGLGTVGSGLLEVLALNAQSVLERTGMEIVVKKVAAKNPNKTRILPAGCELCFDPLALAHDPEIQVVVELMGGKGLAKSLIEEALRNKKHVVTANKALLAEEGEPMFALAASQGVALLYEASVAGAIPVVQTLKDSLAGNQIESFMGILNGTSNFILSSMTSDGMDFATALADATAQGIAEADPTLDIDGYDAAHKLILLIRLAWGLHYPWEKLPIEGIRHTDRMDISFAREFGYTIKMLGHARRVQDTDSGYTYEAGLYPALVHHTLLLARVGKAYNAIRLQGNAMGTLFLHGLGAGSKPTASAVLADILNIAAFESTCKATPRPWPARSNTGFMHEPLPPCPILPPDDSVSPWYIRFMAQDHPGILRDIAGAMAEQGVSIAQVIQKSPQLNLDGTLQQAVPLVFMTHASTTRAIRLALQNLRSESLLAKPVCYRVLEK